MKNIKRILNLILITLVVLSAFMATNVYAINASELRATSIGQKVTPELDSFQNGMDSMEDNIVEFWEYKSDYDMFCSQRGVTIWNISDKLDKKITLVKKDAEGNIISRKNIDVGHEYKENDEYDATGYTSLSDNKSIRAVYKLYTDTEYPKTASPQEAYILSEMFNNTDANKNRTIVGFEEDEESKEDVGTILGGTSLEDYYVFSTFDEAGEETEIYKILGRYWIYRSGFLIPITISEEEVSDAVNYNRSYVQKAWWRTDESQNVTNVDGGKFSAEAQAFEEYILDITGKDDASQLEYVEQEYKVVEQFDDGTTKESTGKVVAPKIEYTPTWKETSKPQEVLWNAEDGRYLVGPFAIDYYTQADDIVSEFLFAGIESSKVSTNVGDLDLNLDNEFSGKEYTFLHADGNINSEYPDPNSEFYIVIPYIEGLKELNNIEFNFKFMNAGGEFNKYKGTGYTETWGISGNKVKKIRKETHDLQDMTEAIHAARWYETTTLTTNATVDEIEVEEPEYAYGDLRVVKNIVDSEDNAIVVEKDKIFEFEVTIKRKAIERNQEGNIILDEAGNYKIVTEEVIENIAITVPEGQSTSFETLPTEVWEKIKIGEDEEGNPIYDADKLAPEYIVKEIDPSSVVIENHNYVATENPAPSGKFVENAENADTKIFEGAIVTVKNIYDGKVNTGKLRIIKEVIDEKGNPKPVKADATFKFSVSVGGEQQEVSITVPKGSTSASWISGEYTWKINEEAPAYSVDEIDAAGYEKVDEFPQTGILSADDVVTVVRINRYNSITKKGYIRVIKELVDENGNPKAAERDESFKFNVYINNELKFEPVLIISEGQTKTNIWTSGPIEWKEDETNPTYKVEEILPANSTFGIYEIINESGNVVESEPELSQLVAVKNTEDRVIDKHGKIKIIKEITDEKGNLITLDEDVAFKFNVVTYVEKEETSREVIEDKVVEIKIPAGSSTGSWELENVYKWTDNVPKYEIKEIDVPENFEFVKIVNKDGQITDINTPITGTFENSENAVTVRATNKTKGIIEHDGKIIIVKKTVDDEGKTFIADKDYEFEFKIEVEGNSPEYITLKLPKGASEVTGESKTYTWKGNVAPTYKVTETKSNGFTPNMTNATGSLLEEGNPTVTAINTKGTINNKGKIQITKHISGPRPVEGPITFKFDLYITYDNRETKQEVQITLNGNDPVTWTSDYYYWNVDENAPRYRVVETDNGGYQDTTIENDNGYLENKEEPISVKVFNTRENVVEYEKGELQIAKKLTDGTNNFTGKIFEFDVWVKGYGTETVTIEAGNSWTKEYTWVKGEEIPEYRVTEKTATGYNIFSGASGNLVANNTVVVEAVNTFNYGNSGSIEIEKIAIVEDKIDNAEFSNIPFKFKTTIYYDDPNELFIYEGKAYNSVEIYKEIRPNCGTEGETSEEFGNFDSPKIEVSFEKADKAPKYVVEEISAPVGWKLISAEGEKGTIQNGSTITASFTNKLPVNRKYIFTMEMGGMVWNDTNYSNGKPIDSEEDGRKAETEAGMPNVIVKIYNTMMDGAQYTLVTDCNGKWSIPNMPVPYDNENRKEASYYVTYTYDGQTYQPTKPLVSGDVRSFAEANDTDRKAYLDNSMAIENADLRNAFNEEFETIEGGSPIDGNGNTIGSTGTGVELNYTSKDIEYNGYVKRDSDLVTLNPDGTAKYGMEASTAELGLYYPFDRRTALVSAEREVLEEPTITYTYHAAYPYLNNVNMGLVERPFADVSIEKELEEAVVVVNGKIYKYKYGEIANTQFAEYPDLLYKQIQINQRNIEYTLNLYTSDYYYRASVYQKDASLWTALQSKYLDVSEQLDLDVYLKYKLIVTNQSDSYSVRINQISDYVDSSLELVTADQEKFIDNIDGNKEEKVVVAKAPSHTWEYAGIYNDTTSGWRETSPVKYTRYKTVLTSPITLNSGESSELNLTFKVKNSVDTLETGVGDCIILGDKNNIAEIDSYSTYYGDGKVAGRVDEDSAPGNISFSKNMAEWYEDDTDKSPTIKLGLYDVVRNVNGIAWEDLETETIDYKQIVGDGLYDDSVENGIGNMTTQLVEKVTVDGKDYDFIWPTGDNVESSGFTLGGSTVYQLTGFDSEILTNNEDGTRGVYSFTGIPAGNYVVRFIYGDENTLDLNARDSKGNIKYSGQDYKSTTYQAGNIVDNDVNDDGFIDNEFHELTSEQLRNTRVSDARDDESRRLEVIAKSQEMFYENTSIMDTNTSSYGVDDTDARVYNDSLKTYYMIANTAKLNMNVESKLDAKEAITKGQVTSSGGIEVNVLNTNLKTPNSAKVTRLEYNVNDIDFGLESRSENNIKLDKQIEQITLKTSAGETLIDAKYSINYEYNYDGGNRTITPKVELIASESIGTENLQALNRTATDLGFRYLNVDKDLLQGATITIKYRITALNTGEVDRYLDIPTTEAEFNTAISNLRQKYQDRDYTSGKYLGQIYYQGATITTSSIDKVVTSKVKQIVDYVDNDVVFSQVDNTAKNASWANTTTVELSSDDNRLIDRNIIDSTAGKVLDNNGVAYEADSKNNLIVSVENPNDEPTLANPNLMTALTPYDAGGNNTASISLTVSRYYSSDMDIEEVENITETLKLYNDVGRRDLRTVQGNTRPATGPLVALSENDSSATELITLSPPTGIVTTAMLVLQIMAIVLVAVTILAGGIVIIKKKVLTK